MKKSLVLTFTALLALSACSDKKDDMQAHSDTTMLPDSSITQPDTNRWYTGEQVVNGQKTFEQICASCHKKDASGSENWKESSPSGVFPPPPLNGNGHTWHHPLDQIHSTIKNGTASLGGNMPAWGKVLSDEKIIETIAFFQSKWSDEVYHQWANKGGMHH
ncbi:c-type cytochrome [Marinicellulosiphila megalodicopiae]|uniref:c-type cytochrome n=1 Tax=Marinicellulosiphila megalodicopiae TaxID=2724896 RepID=UPI003BB08BCD